MKLIKLQEIRIIEFKNLMSGDMTPGSRDFFTL